MSRSGPIRALVLLVFLSFLAEADGQDVQQATRPEITTSASEVNHKDQGRLLLAGPLVKPSAKQDSVSGFNSRRRAASIYPMILWMKNLQSIPLSLDQRTRIESLNQDFQQRRARFNREYGAEFRSLRELVQQNSRNGVQTSPETSSRFQDLRSLLPNMVEYQMQIWKTLKPNQQRQLRSELKKSESPGSDRRPGKGN